MKLITAPIKKLLESTPHLVHDGKKPEDVPVIAKFFLPAGRFSFYVTESEPKKEGDYYLYGFCVSPITKDFDEMGYASFNEMKSVKVMGLGLERDINWTGSLLDAFTANDFKNF